MCPLNLEYYIAQLDIDGRFLGMSSASVVASQTVQFSCSTNAEIVQFFLVDNECAPICSKTIIEIPNYAFYECPMLTSIELPKHVNSIGSCAFANCIAKVICAAYDVSGKMVYSGMRTVIAKGTWQTMEFTEIPVQTMTVHFFLVDCNSAPVISHIQKGR